MGTSPYICCPEGCVIASDDFNRPVSPDPGCGWQKLSGSWSIAGNELRASGAGLIAHGQSHPLNTPTGVVEGMLRNYQPGDIVRIAVNILDEENYEWVELNGLFDYLGVGYTIGGADFPLDKRTGMGLKLGHDYILALCRSPTGIFGGLNDHTDQFVYSIFAWSCVGENPPGKGGHAGFANVVAGRTVDFDDFIWGEHYRTNKDCPKCECSCGQHTQFPQPIGRFCMASTLKLEFYDATGSCSDLEGEKITLQRNNGRNPEMAWDGKKELPHWDGESGTQNYEFRLVCGCDECGNDRIGLVPLGTGLACSTDWDDSCSTHVEYYPTAKCAEILDCKPLRLEFGKFVCSGSGPPEPPPECSVKLRVIE